VTRSGPVPQVAPRQGAVASLEKVNVVSSSAEKNNVFPQSGFGSRGGTDLQTRLIITAWVANLAFAKNVWADFHVFDSGGALCAAETSSLTWAGPGGGGGDLFTLDQRVFQGSVATPGSVSPRPDAATVQYRLYYQVNGDLFTDRILHQHHVPTDGNVH
jgi:hypothetical protein